MSVRTRSRPKQTRRTWQARLGWGLVLVGLALLGWLAWELVGTNVVAEKRHRTIVSGLHERWRLGQDQATVDGVRAGAVIRIPRFGKDYEIPVLEGVGDRELSSGFGHFPGTGDVGAVGNYALAAHRVTHGQPLHDMPDLRSGDRVVIETRTHVYTYVLDTGGGDLVVRNTGTWVLDPLPRNPEAGGVQPAQDQAERLLTLTTCSELFHTDDRSVAFGHLASVRVR